MKIDRSEGREGFFAIQRLYLKSLVHSCPNREKYALKR
jgi:hypothetical protein